MTTYGRKEIVSRIVEFAVKSGSDVGTVSKVEAIAYDNYCTLTGRSPADHVYDDWCTVEARDDEIVFRFVVEKAEVTQ